MRPYFNHLKPSVASSDKKISEAFPSILLDEHEEGEIAPPLARRAGEGDDGRTTIPVDSPLTSSPPAETTIHVHAATLPASGGASSAATVTGAELSTAAGAGSAAPAETSAETGISPSQLTLQCLTALDLSAESPTELPRSYDIRTVDLNEQRYLVVENLMVEADHSELMLSALAFYDYNMENSEFVLFQLILNLMSATQFPDLYLDTATFETSFRECTGIIVKSDLEGKVKLYLKIVGGDEAVYFETLKTDISKAHKLARKLISDAFETQSKEIAGDSPEKIALTVAYTKLLETFNNLEKRALAYLSLFQKFVKKKLLSQHLDEEAKAHRLAHLALQKAETLTGRVEVDAANSPKAIVTAAGAGAAGGAGTTATLVSAHKARGIATTASLFPSTKKEILPFIAKAIYRYGNFFVLVAPCIAQRYEFVNLFSSLGLYAPDSSEQEEDSSLEDSAEEDKDILLEDLYPLQQLDELIISLNEEHDGKFPLIADDEKFYSEAESIFPFYFSGLVLSDRTVFYLGRSDQAQEKFDQFFFTANKSKIKEFYRLIQEKVYETYKAAMLSEDHSAAISLTQIYNKLASTLLEYEKCAYAYYDLIRSLATHRIEPESKARAEALLAKMKSGEHPGADRALAALSCKF